MDRVDGEEAICFGLQLINFREILLELDPRERDNVKIGVINWITSHSLSGGFCTYCTLNISHARLLTAGPTIRTASLNTQVMFNN